MPAAELLADLGGDVGDVDEARVEEVRPVDGRHGVISGPDLVSAMVVNRVSMPPTLTAS